MRWRLKKFLLKFLIRVVYVYFWQYMTLLFLSEKTCCSIIMFLSENHLYQQIYQYRFLCRCFVRNIIRNVQINIIYFLLPVLLFSNLFLFLQLSIFSTPFTFRCTFSVTIRLSSYLHFTSDPNTILTFSNNTILFSRNDYY